MLPNSHPTVEMMNTCADMILANAIEDMAEEEGVTTAEAREALISSPAYHCLYNLDSGMWMEGPDYLQDFYNKCKAADRINE